ncbi:hypothetical protein Tco_1067877 [Tanacetum coccineum]|uniref:Retrotransposon gag domain-containing protein n=1 Tax=Tanacetum coccineum TaxID=301880 RepID=A0ABQ5HFY4_9ASTR
MVHVSKYGVPDFSTIIAQQNQNRDAVNDNIRGDVSRGCTYKEFFAYNPKEYDGKGGVIVYTRWIEKMESVEDMSGYRDSQKVKYTAGSFFGMSWEDFKILTREEFCPSNEMQKLETELRNHAMVGASHVAYTDRFHELARLMPHLVTLKGKRIERYVYDGALSSSKSRNEGRTSQRPSKSCADIRHPCCTLTKKALRNGPSKRTLRKEGMGENLARIGM